MRTFTWPLSIAAAALAGLVLASSGCDDPICAFGSDCFGGDTPGALGSEAVVPAPGALILSAQPEILELAPAGGSAIASTTPVAIFFTESMSAESLDGAFQLTTFSNQVGIELPVQATQVAVADGRGLLLLPLLPLEGGSAVNVIYAADSGPALDLTGQELNAQEDTVIANFNVALNDPAEPAVVLQWPLDGALNQGRSSELVTIFDRPMDPATFTEDAYRVRVDGATVDPDPSPGAIDVGPGIGAPVPDTRVWTYTRLDDGGAPLDFAPLAEVTLGLSGVGQALLASDGGTLPTLDFGFRTMEPAAPIGALLTSEPADAIGLANLNGDGVPAEITVTLEDGQPGDQLDAYLIAQSLDEEPRQVAVARSTVLDGVAPITEVVLDFTTLELIDDAGAPIFSDGGLFAAFSLTRDGITTPVGLLDLDPDPDGVLGVAFDTTPPELVELAGNLAPEGSEGVYTLRGDLRDLVLAGVAGEELRAVEITTPLGATAAAAPVLGAGADGAFVSAAVPLGVLAPAEQDFEFEFVLFDRALNASAPIAATFRQVGAIGPDPLAPGATGQPIAVEVVDAVSLRPLEGALVVTHADLGDGNYPLIGSAVTDSDGRATVTSHISGQTGTLLTVDLAGYDLLTLHGLESVQVSVPLQSLAGATAALSGAVTSDSPLAQLVLPASTLALADTRLPFDALRAFEVDACTQDPFQGLLTCGFGPQQVLAERFGAAALFAGTFDLPVALFTPALFLQVSELSLAVPPAGGEPLSIVVGQLASEPGAPAEAAALPGPQPAVSATVTQGFDFATAVDVGPLAGVPDLSVDVSLPGLTAPVVVGLGLAYPVGEQDWITRLAYSGVVPGLLEGLGELDDLLHATVEFRNESGELTAARLPFSTLPSQLNTLFPSNIPDLDAALENTSTGGASFTVEPANALADLVFGVPDFGSGLYEAEVVDGTGRAWRVQRSDLEDSTFFRIPLHLPDIAAAGGSPLAAGELQVSVRCAAWPSYTIGSRLFSDTLRERSYYAETRPQVRQQP